MMCCVYCAFEFSRLKEDLTFVNVQDECSYYGNLFEEKIKQLEKEKRNNEVKRNTLRGEIYEEKKKISEMFDGLIGDLVRRKQNILGEIDKMENDLVGNLSKSMGDLEKQIVELQVGFEELDKIKHFEQVRFAEKVEEIDVMSKKEVSVFCWQKVRFEAEKASELRELIKGVGSLKIGESERRKVEEVEGSVSEVEDRLATKFASKPMETVSNRELKSGKKYNYDYNSLSMTNRTVSYKRFAHDSSRLEV